MIRMQPVRWLLQRARFSLPRPPEVSRWSLIGGLALLLAIGPAPTSAQPADSTRVVVGSKKFTENVILGWMATHLIEATTSLPARHEAELGGSRFLWEALLRGGLDVYPAYTGTLTQEILPGTAPTRAALRDTLAHYNLRMTAPLGFNNTYALGMRAAQARRLGIESIADLRAHPDLTFAFTNEFMKRSDGWPALKRAYELPQSAQGVDHALAYRGLRSGAIDVTDVYTTDAELAAHDLRVLADTRNFFPAYQAVYVYRADLPAAAAQALQRLAGRIDAATMQRLNRRAKIDGQRETVVAARFLNRTFSSLRVTPPPAASWVDRVWQRTREHVGLVGVSLAVAVVLGIPLGIVAARVRWVGPGVLLLVGVTYTIPSLALLALMVPLIGLGYAPAVLALTLYSLLPIVWNTFTGLRGIEPSLQESAAVLGLSPTAKLLRVDLPLAARSIGAGIKIAAVINIGTATLGALIGAGGYGQPILTGIRRADVGLILEGTVPAAVLTVAVLAVLEGVQRGLLPRSLRTSE